jgi:hypothetical protein
MKTHTFGDTRTLNFRGNKSCCECIGVCGCCCGLKVFPLSLSVKCSVSKNGSQHASQTSLIVVWLFQRSAVTTCQVWKCTAFIEYV